MEKSISTKEFKLVQQAITDIGIKHLQNWTNKQLSNYTTKPVVIPYGNHGFLIGIYKVIKISPTCYRVQQSDDTIIGDFFSKNNAVFYCLESVSNRHSSAENVRNMDVVLGNLDTDIEYYQHFMRKVAKNNPFKYGLLLNRCIDAKIKRREILEILKKTVNMNKYLKLGNKPL